MRTSPHLTPPHQLPFAPFLPSCNPSLDDDADSSYGDDEYDYEEDFEEDEEEEEGESEGASGDAEAMSSSSSTTSDNNNSDVGRRLSWEMVGRSAGMRLAHERIAFASPDDLRALSSDSADDFVFEAPRGDEQERRVGSEASSIASDSADGSETDDRPPRRTDRDDVYWRARQEAAFCAAKCRQLQRLRQHAGQTASSVQQSRQSQARAG